MQRITSLDLARGFTVLIMPSIHVVMLYSQAGVQESLLGDILAFIAEGPGAQLFMLIMGIGFAFSSRLTSVYIIQRTCMLLIAAYALNIFKFIIPLYMGWLPDNLLNDLSLSNDYSSSFFFFYIGDVLHFAAIAFPLTYLVYRLKHYQYWSLLLAIVIMLLSPYVWDYKTGNAPIDHVLILFNGHPPETFFPVFPWLFYPLAGLSLGYFLKRFNVTKVIRIAGYTGFLLIAISLYFPPTMPQKDWLPFYRTAPADTIFHLGFVWTWLMLFQWLNKKIPDNPFFKLLTFCSKNITAIYILQWIMICWCLSITGYLQLDFTATFCWMAGITTATLVFTFLLTYARRK